MGSCRCLSSRYIALRVIGPRLRLEHCWASMADADSGPQSVGEEVTLMFRLFDVDSDGKISIEELKNMLQSLDKSAWNDERVNKLLSDFDKNLDGDIGFVEFWTWICGHGG